jgi:hypothetical protein
MRTEWYRGCTNDAEKQERKEMVMSAKPTLDILHRMVKTKLAEKEMVANSAALYDSPSWPYLQADKTGEMRVLKDMLEILNISDQEETK